MSTPVAGPSHLPHPSPAPGQAQFDQKRRQESDDTRRAYASFYLYMAYADQQGNTLDHLYRLLIFYKL